MVKSLACDLAVYKLYRGRVTSEDGVYKPVRDAYEDAIKLLKSLNKGEAALDVPAAEETATNPGSPDRVLSGNTRSVMTDENLRGY
jgi:phage gp36-like protein